MGKLSISARWIWARIGDVWLAKDIIVLLVSVAGATGAPLLVWAFSPLSPIDTVLLIVGGGVIAFFVARYFGPRVRHIHHLPILAENRSQASLSMVVHRGDHEEGAAPMWKAVAHVREKLNDVDAKECFPMTLTALRQAALDGRIKIRGRREIDTHAQHTVFSEVISDISPEYWKVSTVGALATDPQFHERGFPHTNPETAFAWGAKGVYEKNRYTDLTVDMNEIRRVWP